MLAIIPVGGKHRTVGSNVGLWVVSAVNIGIEWH